jgi:PAS domain S-box-containing protein
MRHPSGETLRQRILLFLSLLIIFVGLWTARESGQRTDLRMRRELARQARSIAAAISPEDIRTLSFTADDVQRPEFQRLSTQLKTYADAAGLRSLYTMALRNGQLVFGPENLSPNDPYASPPGTVYQTPSVKDVEIFQTGEAMIQGPATDEYGEFVTATIPVTDPRTGEVLMTVGQDVEASVWLAEIRKAQWIPFLTAMIPLGILLAGYFLLKIRQRFAHTHQTRLRHTEAIICAIIMLLLTLITAMLFHDAEKKSREETFRALAQIEAAVYTDVFQDLRNSLDMLARFCESSETVSRSEFGFYTKLLLDNSPIQACVWLPAVAAADAARFAGDARAEGFPDFSVWQLNEQRLPEPAQGDPFFPLLYVEPLSIHAKALGYDLHSEPLRRAAIEEALRTGQAAATESIHLFALPDNPPAFFIFKPVASPQNKGIAGFAVRPEILLTSQIHHPASEASGLSVSLFQLRSDAPPIELATSMESCDRECWPVLRSEMHTIIPVFTFGKTYSLLIAPEPKWLAENPLLHRRTVLIIGFALTLLLTVLIATLANRPALLEKRVQQRTAELQESQARLRTLLETIPDLIWLKDAAGVYLSCNTAFERLYGATEAEITGKTDYDFVEKELADFFRLHDRNAMKKDGPGINEEWLTFAVDGYRGLFETIKTPVRDADGHLIGVLGIARDITARKKAEEQVHAQVEELNRWHQATMGRETRVLELKKEINDILRHNGEPPRYKETAESS